MATSPNKTAAFEVKLIHKCMVETPLNPEKLTVWCALWAGGVIGPYFFKNDEGHNVKSMSLVYADKPQTLDHLEDNIRRVIADRRPQMLEKVIENWTSRLDYIRASRGSHSQKSYLKCNATRLSFE
ncbi:hypothetical protein TNCV_1568221 [Trichonephila clavipes]|nr:hypothetical protein TNCV_1568221 [Trichonephila clavipes]